jgi:putative aldouronate transport system permease protein
MLSLFNRNKIKKSKEDQIMIFLFSSIILIFTLASIFPFILVLTSSFTDERSLALEGYKLIPSKWSVSAYQLLFQTKSVLNAYKVTIFITVVGTFLSMLFTSSMAYAMSVKNFRIRNSLAFFVYFTMLFSGGLVASYILISKYLNMKDTIWVLIIPALMQPYNLLLLRNFFSGIPESLAESAKIDGANDIRILFSIILPVSLPGIATIGLFYALGYWNEWYKVLLYINNEKLYTLQYLIMKILRQINYAISQAAQSDLTTQFQTVPTYSYRMATIIVTIGPIILLYPSLQKYFVKGLTVGSVKG